MESIIKAIELAAPHVDSQSSGIAGNVIEDFINIPTYVREREDWDEIHDALYMGCHYLICASSDNSDDPNKWWDDWCNGNEALVDFSELQAIINKIEPDKVIIEWTPNDGVINTKITTMKKENDIVIFHIEFDHNVCIVGDHAEYDIYNSIFDENDLLYGTLTVRVPPEFNLFRITSDRDKRELSIVVISINTLDEIYRL